MIPQLFVPIAAELSSDKEKSANIGLVMSGLLLGILLSRFIGGSSRGSMGRGEPCLVLLQD